MTIAQQVVEAVRRQPGTALEIAHRMDRTLGSVAAHLTLMFQAGRLNRREMPSQLHKGKTASVYFADDGAPCVDRAEPTVEEIKAAYAAMRAAKPLPPKSQEHPRWKARRRESNCVARRCGARRILTRVLPQRARAQE